MQLLIKALRPHVERAARNGDGGDAPVAPSKEPVAPAPIPAAQPAPPPAAAPRPSPEPGPNRWKAPLAVLVAVLVLGGGWAGYNRWQEAQRREQAQRLIAEQKAEADKRRADQLAADKAAKDGAERAEQAERDRQEALEAAERERLRAQQRKRSAVAWPSRPPAPVPVVLFPLVPNRAHDDVVTDDLEENDVTRATERNDPFARAAMAKFCLTACVRRPGQPSHGLADGVQWSLRMGPVRCLARKFALDGEVLQTPQILHRFLHEGDRVLERYRPAR